MWKYWTLLIIINSHCWYYYSHCSYLHNINYGPFSGKHMTKHLINIKMTKHLLNIKIYIYIAFVTPNISLMGQIWLVNPCFTNGSCGNHRTIHTNPPKMMILGKPMTPLKPKPPKFVRCCVSFLISDLKYPRYSL